jgi:hypothetical protein
MRKREPLPGQASLFDEKAPRKTRHEKVPGEGSLRPAFQSRKWVMPDAQGRTVAEIRLRWLKRLTPAQVARVEVELADMPRVLTKLGFGTVEVEHAFVRRRKT